MTYITHFPKEKTSLPLQLSSGFISWAKWINMPIQTQGDFLQDILNFKVSCFNGQWPHPESLGFPPHLGLLEVPISQQGEPEGWRQAGRR